MKHFTRILCIIVIAVGVINFGTFIFHTQRLGGDALNGRQANGRFYVSEKGKETEVSQQQWQFNRWHALSLIITHPLALGAMALLALKHEFPKKMFRGSAEQRERTVEEIRSSGAVVRQFESSGKIGAVVLSAPFMDVAVYPAGFICNIRFMSAFGVLSSEIESMEQSTSMLKSGVVIVHRSPNVVSPILLRCDGSESLKRALLSLVRRDLD